MTRLPDSPVSERIRVLIVDDHTLVREGLRALLEDDAGIQVVGAVGTVRDALSEVEASRPQVVLMDYRLGDEDGTSATTAIRDRYPDVAVVFLSAMDNDSALFAAVEAGAVGYLVKSGTMDEVADAVRRAAAGEMLVPQSVLTRLIQAQRQRATEERNRERLREGLTAREVEILRLMAQGGDNQQIAEKLFISYQTVRGHVRNILAKLDCHTKLAAVARAVQYGLIDKPAV